MKKGLILLASATGLVAARAEVVFDESFSYDDGPIIVQATDTWKNHSGTNEQTEVYEGQLILTQANSEDFHAKLAGGPYMKSSGGTSCPAAAGVTSRISGMTVLVTGRASLPRARVRRGARFGSASPRRAKRPPPWWTTTFISTRFTRSPSQ